MKNDHEGKKKNGPPPIYPEVDVELELDDPGEIEQRAAELEASGKSFLIWAVGKKRVGSPRRFGNLDWTKKK